MATYQLKLIIPGSEPAIWRMVEVPSTFSLVSMHRLIQLVMNWSDFHLHKFVASKQCFANKSVCNNYRTDVILYDDITIKDVLLRKRSKMKYTYDFGDNLVIDIVVEEIIPTQDILKPRCIAGEMAPPFENFGGLWGYYDLLDAFEDKKKGLENQNTQWLDEIEFGDEYLTYDATEFDLEQVNRMIDSTKFTPTKKKSAKRAAEIKLCTNKKAKKSLAELVRLIEDLDFDGAETPREIVDKILGESHLAKKKGKQTDAQKTEQLIDQALDSSLEEAKKLLNKALKLSPSNVQALCLLASMEDDEVLATSMYLKATHCAKEELGNDFIEKHKGKLYDMPEAFGYLTAKLAYADCLKGQDMVEEAIVQYQEILTLDVDDNQLASILIAPLLLRTKKYAAFLDVYKKYADKSTFWLFNYAIYLYLRSGESPFAKKSLQEANKANKHVIKLLLTRNLEFDNTTNEYDPGSHDEAVFYIMTSINFWIALPETIFWMQSALRR